MVKRKSCLASNEAFQVRLLVGVLERQLMYGVCGVAVAARLAVNQRVGVRLSPDTLGKTNDECRMTKGTIMIAESTPAADAGPEPQLAAGERGHGGPGAGAGVERVGPRGRSGRLSALHLG